MFTENLQVSETVLHFSDSKLNESVSWAGWWLHMGTCWPRVTQCYTWALHTFQILKLHISSFRLVMTKLDSILKIRDITLPTNICLIKAMVFPVVMYRCESWTMKKLSTKELMFLNCGVGEDSESPLDCKEIQPVHPKGDQSWAYKYVPNITGTGLY